MIEKKSVRKRVVLKSEEKRLVYGEVYSPYHIDTDGEAMTPDEIERMAHSFMMNGDCRKIDVSHNYQESGCIIVESFIARKNDSDGFLEGSWVLGVKVLPDDLWLQVKKGELNGFSFAGGVNKQKVKVKVQEVRKLEGTTEKSTGGLLPEHSHKIDLRFDETGNIIASKTSEDFGHSHDVLKATATESAFDHSHRMILIENGEG